MKSKKTKLLFDIDKKILNSRGLLECIAILESIIKKESGFDYLKICIFDNSKTMECLSKKTCFEENILPNPDHYSFNCMLYKLKEWPSGIIDKKYLMTREFSCMLVTNHNVNVAFSDIFTYKKIGAIVGFNFDGREILTEQLSVLKGYADKYSNIINVFRRLDERKAQIDYLSFLADVYKRVPEKAEFSATIKKIISMISKTFDFDICVFIQHNKNKLPEKIKDAVKAYYCNDPICEKIIKKSFFLEYPYIEKVNEYRLRNEVYGSSFSYICETKTELSKNFDEFVIIPLNEIDDNQVSYIFCLNRKDKKSLNKKTISQLTVFQNQILSTLKNVALVNDIKEDYKEIRDLHEMSYRLNLVTQEDKIIQNAFDEVVDFFNADIGAVYGITDSSFKSLFSKNLDSIKDADNSNVNNKMVRFLLLKDMPRKTNISSSKMPDFVDYNTKIKYKSQILIYIMLNKRTEYLFILQSNIDYYKKRKYSILSEIIASTITRIIENTRMHQKIISYNEILLADKQKLSDAITEDREKLFNIVNGMDEPLIAFNSDWIIEIFNDAAESMFGIDKENIVKTDAKLFINHWKVPINATEHVLKKRILEYTINDKFYKIIKTPYRARDGRQGTVLVFENVTKEREVEEMKNEFISLLSHEMKTPLTSITGFSKLMLMGKLGNISEQQKDCVDVIHDEGERLKNLVEEILDIDRLEKGKLTLNKTLVNLIDVFSDTIDNKIILKNNTITIVKEFPTKIPLIMVDEDKIRQVLINLVSNAIKFTDDKGSIIVKVSNNDKEIIIEVTDTGIGMKQEDLKYIFEKFYQVQNHLTRSQGGVGLGLSIVKKILDLHNGHIEVKSKLGKGSTFTFYLPIKS